MTTRFFFADTGEYIGGFNDISQVPENAIEVGEPPLHGLDRLINGSIIPYEPVKPLIERLNEFFTANLPDEAQADFAPLKVSVRQAMEEGRPNIAKLIIQRATVPEELEPLRAQLLALFPEV